MFKQATLKKLLIIFGLQMAGIILVATLAVDIFVEKINTISQSITEQKRLSEILERKTETLQQLDKDIALVNSNDKRILDALPPVYNILDFSAVLENQARASSLKQQITLGSPISLTPEKTEGIRLAAIDYTVALGGNVHTLTRYLTSFEGLPYFTRINAIGVQGNPELGWEGESSIVLRATVYTADPLF